MGYGLLRIPETLLCAQARASQDPDTDKYPHHRGPPYYINMIEGQTISIRNDAEIRYHTARAYTILICASLSASTIDSGYSKM